MTFVAHVAIKLKWCYFLFSSGWTWWWERGELPLLPKALHGFVAERSQVYSDHCWHEEVSTPTFSSGTNTSWASGPGDFHTELALRSKPERNWEVSFSNPNHFSLINRCVAQSVQQSLEGGARGVYKELCVAVKQTPSLIEALLCEFLRVITGEQIRSGNFERMLIIEWFRTHTQRASRTGDHSQRCLFL